MEVRREGVKQKNLRRGLKGMEEDVRERKERRRKGGKQKMVEEEGKV